MGTIQIATAQWDDIGFDYVGGDIFGLSRNPLVQYHTDCATICCAVNPDSGATTAVPASFSFYNAGYMAGECKCKSSQYDRSENPMAVSGTCSAVASSTSV